MERRPPFSERTFKLERHFAAKKKVVSMTICISAMAAKSKAIVCIADRAVTYAATTGGPASQSDSGAKKIIDLGASRWVALVAGDLSFAQKVTERISASLGSNRSPSRAEMQTFSRKAYQDCQQEVVIEQVLVPNLLTVDDYLRRPNSQLPLDTKYTLEIAEMIAAVQSDCALIICGFDTQGAHIFKVTDGGAISPCDMEGYAVVGGGEDASRGRIIWSQIDRAESLESVMYDVFDAKVAAEIVQSVGYVWDWKILVAGKRPQNVPRIIDDLIDRLWISSNRSPYAEKLGKRQMPPRGWKTKFSRFADKALAPVAVRRSASRKSKGRQ
jgi:hypothetical protein